MRDVREVAESVRDKRTWSIREIRAAIPRMRPERVESTLRRAYGRSAGVKSVVGPTGWHWVPGARATHWFLRGWAICGFGTTGQATGRVPDEYADPPPECPECRRAIERTKVA